nr:MAG TPA: hypothetical protein [Caudoviricetes sp.]
MSIQTEIDRITGAKTTLANYLAQNGVTAPAGASIDELAILLADVIEKQDKITASGILKGDGAGGVTAAVAGTDYATPSTIAFVLNRNTAVDAADTNYAKYMARGESLNSAETTPTANGCIAWTYA